MPLEDEGRESSVKALPVLNFGVRLDLLLSATLRLLYPRERDPVPILQETIRV
jgi:hypothetical protein